MKNPWRNVWIFGQICWLIFGRFLGGFWKPFWLSNSGKNPLKNWAKFWLIFWWLFERKCLPNGRPRGPQNRYISCTFRDPVPGTPLGKQMEPKWIQNGTKMRSKWSPNWAKSSQTPIRFVCLFYIYLFSFCWLKWWVVYLRACALDTKDQNSLQGD